MQRAHICKSSILFSPWSMYSYSWSYFDLSLKMNVLSHVLLNYFSLDLQAYREVFEYLIEDFKTYKPLLSSIKTEYEMMLAQQREQIRELEPLKVGDLTRKALKPVSAPCKMSGKCFISVLIFCSFCYECAHAISLDIIRYQKHVHHR